MNRVFLDTNILIYAHDRSQPGKWARARELVAQFAGPGPAAVISTQVLQEFYNALVRKLQFSPADAKLELLRVAQMPAVTVTPSIIAAAADLHASAALSFWDALIIAAAQYAGCDELWSEDLQTGRTFGKLKIINPLT